MTKQTYWGRFKLTDRELDAFMEAPRPLSPEEADLHVTAVFLTTAHRHKKKGKELEKTRSLYKRLIAEPGLVDELRKRKLLQGPLIEP